MKKKNEKNEKIKTLFEIDTTFKSKRYIIIIYLILTELIIQKAEEKTINKSTSYQSSYITLRIKGKGNQKILGGGNEYSNNNFNKTNYPNEIKINGRTQSTINYSYYFNEEDNLLN